MEKIKMTQRIYNAIRALRGEPWPAQIAFPLPKIERHNIQAFGVIQEVPVYFTRETPENMDFIQRDALAVQLGRELLKAGAIELSTGETTHPGIDGPLVSKLYRAKIRVVMPEKQEG